MTTNKVYFTLLLILIYQNVYSQIFFANNALIQINSNAVVHTNGGVILTNGTDLTNNGTLQVTKNSTFPQAGNFRQK